MNKYKDYPQFDRCGYCKYVEVEGNTLPCKSCLQGNDSRWEPPTLDQILGLI